jgi:hypothetical protein
MSVWGHAGEETCGDVLEVMARIASSQPNGAMARIAPHISIVKTVKFQSAQARFLGLDPKLFS